MADCLLIAGTTDRILQAGTTDCILIAGVQPVVTVGGLSGGRTKPIGYKLVSDELGNRPVKHIPSLTKGKLKLKTETISIGRLQIPIRNVSESIIKPFHVVGISTSEIQIKTSTESIAQLKRVTIAHTTAEIAVSMRILKPHFAKMDKLKKLVELSTLYQMSEGTDNVFTIPLKKKSFQFEGNTKEWAAMLKEELRTFDHSSSFIGTVVYDEDRQELFITIGSTVYTFCSVPNRIFDSFEGAASKGEFFNRSIKTQFDC